MSVLGKPVVRAAVYTRKSSDEGLDQEFNSLDAQHEACSAYIASQRHEGWKLIKRRFDDGGISGGTLERPALKTLLADVDQGIVDMIVVYKIDRLTRSLSDFAKLIDRLEAKGCSFVSVTQSFNTSSSMGRLTLNVLLSFARCCQTNEPKHQYLVDGYFYEITKERHSVRAASRLSLNVLRFESDLCELNRL